MFFEEYKSILYSDTLVPDIFISEYMPSMEGDFVKVYIHWLFLCKYNKKADINDIASKLNMEVDRVKEAFLYLERVGVVTKKDNDCIVLNDLKEKEINKLYRLKTTSSPEEAIFSSERNKKRNETIRSINNKYYQGLMPPSMYNNIDAWFDRYKFDEDVMYALFQHCYQYNGLHPSYIEKVAQSWYNRNIRTFYELEEYINEYEKFKDIRGKIVKKLKLGRNLTEYEESYVEKWVMEYKYDFEIIELALKKTTSKTNPNFKYIDSIISDWYNKGLDTKEKILLDIKNFESKKTSKTGTKKVEAAVAPQRGNFEQRQYDDGYFEGLYDNVDIKKDNS